ncbi:amidase [Pseudomonas sp. MPB23]|uniref:amidase n=1 Tax=Pseudomonas sp. MPB23 TaxID=3388490 RepID=UPI003984CD3F
MDLKFLALCSTLLLSACNHQPWVPYVDPPVGSDTARLRVITNGEVRGGAYTGCVGNEQGLARAGRFGSDGQPSINYPQSPVTPPQLSMPPRKLPTLDQYLGAIRMAEGAYTEIVAEYRVPAGTPFVLKREALAAGVDGQRYFQCAADTQVVTFEKGKDYELYTGMKYANAPDGSVSRRCLFLIYELSAGTFMPIAATAPAERACR